MKKIILFTILIILFSIPSFAGNKYVNGSGGSYTWVNTPAAGQTSAAGDDAAGNGSIATPWLTLTKAVSVASSDNDVIYMADGLYNEAAAVSTGRLNLSIYPDTDYGAIIRAATLTTRVLHINKETTTGIIGKIVIDANNTQGSCVTTNSSGDTDSVNFTGTKFLNPTSTFLALGRVKNLNLIDTIGQATGNVGYTFYPTIADGAYIVTGGSTTVAAPTGNKIIMDFTSNGSSTSTFACSGHTFNIAGNPTSLQILYAKGAVSYDIHSNVINSSAATNVKNIVVPLHNTIDATAVLVYNNTGTNSAATTGGFVFIGNDVDVEPANPNSFAGVEVYGNNFTGGNHAYFFGWVTAAEAYNNVGNNIVIGMINKYCTTNLYHNNILNGGALSGGALRSKGGAGNKFYNNTAYFAGVGTEVGLMATDTSTNNDFKNNLIYSPTNSTGKLVDIEAASTAIFVNNTYYAGATPAANSWSYQGTAYSTFTLWAAAEGASDYGYADPKLKSSTDFHLTAGSPAINTGSDVSLTSDFDGKTIPYSTAPDIGAYEYMPKAVHRR